MMKDKYKVLIISCWILLGICFLVKLCGGNFFEIAVHNETFINICNVIDNNLIIKYIVGTILYLPSTYLIYLSLTKQKIGADWWILLLSIPVSWLKDNIFIIGLTLDMIILILISLIKSKFKNWLRVLIGILLICGLQIISLFIRNLGFYLENYSSLLAIIMQIDYYIMLILYYLYSNRKEMN
ncbi:hypothetical protein [Mammaliicoccus vitulinus]|uniref:hypothetical protein n=1 Tax=Mammaliicoccus vitulinus TaxID=71237 RepID=UPI00248CF5D4|nr:hypothetical protein [Mammaliicoccus vitulinus]